MWWSKNINQVKHHKMKETHPLFNHDGHINTYSGIKFNLLNPTKEQISIFDICKGLAHTPHFGGQTPEFFSVAQHCLLVCDLMPPRFKRKPNLMMAALLHDASEAYYGDMLKPLKILLPKFNELEQNAMKVIFSVWDLDLELLKTVKPYDKEAQKIEYNTFFKRTNVLQYYSPKEAVSMFMNRYWDYYNALNPELEEENPF